MPTIAADCDGVLVEVNKVIVEEWKRRGLNISFEDITSFNYADSLGQEAHDIAYEVFMRPDLYDELAPALGVLEALSFLRSRTRVIAVSSPFEQHASSKWKFLRRCGFSHGDIYLCGDKSLIKADLLIDDRAETFDTWPHFGILFDRPWNQHTDSIIRALDWNHVALICSRLFP